MTDLSRNALCRCGSGAKYKKCCLPKDEAQRIPQTGDDAVIVCMPTRGQITYETQLAIELNMRDVRFSVIRVGRKPVVEARNTLAAAALRLRENNPFPFTPREWFVLWADDDAWWPEGAVGETVRALRATPQLDAIFGKFGGRVPYSKPFAYRKADDSESYPKENIDCGFGDLVVIERAGFHWVVMRLSLLQRVGTNPFSIPENGDLPEDFAFCDRARAAGAKLAVGMGAPIVHIDPRDGAAYLPGMPAMLMKNNSVSHLTMEHQLPNGTVKGIENRDYGKEFEPIIESVKRDEAAWLQEARRRMGGVA